MKSNMHRLRHHVKALDRAVSAQTRNFRLQAKQHGAITMLQAPIVGGNHWRRFSIMARHRAMATAVMIYDTLKLAEQLEHEAGFDASHAKSMARILAENTGGNLATREDILVTTGELKGEIHGARGELQSVKSELEGKIQGVSNEVQGLRVEMQDIRGDIRVLYWMIGTTLAGVVGTLSIAITIGLHAIRLE